MKTGFIKTSTAFLLAAALTLPAFADEPRAAPELAINMPDGSQKLLSSFKGKPVMLSFFFTTCPHCQDMSRLLSSQIVPEYAPKGVQFLAAAFDDNAKEQVGDFNAKYVHGFTVGWVERGSVYEFLQKSIVVPLYVPILVFIDRKGIIQSEYVGDPVFLKDPPHNVRAELDKLLAKPVLTTKAATHLTKK
jgi:thiol-disulfide isomerase/thioredoxin